MCWPALLFGIWMCVAAVNVVGCLAPKGCSFPSVLPSHCCMSVSNPLLLPVSGPCRLARIIQTLFFFFNQCPTQLPSVLCNELSQKDQLVCLRLGLMKPSCSLVCCLQSGNQSGTEMLAGGFLPSAFLLGADIALRKAERHMFCVGCWASACGIGGDSVPAVELGVVTGKTVVRYF